MKTKQILLSVISTFAFSTLTFAGPFDVPADKEYNAAKSQKSENKSGRTKRPCGCTRR